VEGAHGFLGNSPNTNLICQAKGESGQALVTTPTLETNEQKKWKNVFSQEKLEYYSHPQAGVLNAMNSNNCLKFVIA
jgi:hypothetical protein